jgi:hypothetical protein
MKTRGDRMTGLKLIGVITVCVILLALLINYARTPAAETNNENVTVYNASAPSHDEREERDENAQPAEAENSTVYEERDEAEPGLETEITEEPDAPEENVPLSYGLTVSEIKTQLENDTDFVRFVGDNYPDWRPNWEGFTDNDTVTIGETFAEVTIFTHWGDIVVNLSYSVENGILVWDIDSYKAPATDGFRPRQIPRPRHLTNLERVTVGFAFYCTEIDPYVNLLPEALKFNEEEIDGQNLWTEFIRLMREHTGIRVTDLWYQETRLYVDLAPVETIVFNWGTTGSAHRQNILLYTLFTLPDVTEIVILIGGEAGVYADHFSFDRVITKN